MGHLYREEFEIPYSMSDVAHRAKLPDLLSECLSVSGRQSLALGISDEVVFETYGLVWIITDYEVTIHRLPRLYEKVIIETEAISYNKFFCYRSFRVFDQKGGLLLDVLTYFALLDWETRKAHPVLPEIVAPYGSTFEKKLRRSRKYTALEDPVSVDYRVRFYDIDMNGHVNNTKYLDWMYDVLGFEFLTEHIPHRLDLKYSKEVAPGGVIQSCVRREGDTTYHEIQSDGVLNAQAVIEWQKTPEE